MVQVELPAVPASVRAARQFVAEALEGCAVGEACELLVSELASNAVLHACTPFRLSVIQHADHVRIEVADADVRLPVVKDYGVEAVTGRGLQIVERAATRWGVEPAASGKTVWFELEDARAGEPPPTEDLVEVRLVDLPVQLWAEARAHMEALHREFDLILLDRPDERTSTPHAFLDLVERLRTEFPDASNRADTALRSAQDQGLTVTTLSFEIDRRAGEAAAELEQMFDEVDAYCRTGALLTHATPDGARRFRRWFLGEFIRQTRGEPARPWTDAFTRRDDDEAGASASSSFPRAIGPYRGPDGWTLDSDGSSVRVRVSGVLDLDAASELRDALQHASAVAATTIEIDLHAVDFVDSLGLSVLFAARARALQEGKRFVIVVPPVLRRTFELAGLDHLVAVEDDED